MSGFSSTELGTFLTFINPGDARYQKRFLPSNISVANIAADSISANTANIVNLNVTGNIIANVAFANINSLTVKNANISNLDVFNARVANVLVIPQTDATLSTGSYPANSIVSTGEGLVMFDTNAQPIFIGPTSLEAPGNINAFQLSANTLFQLPNILVNNNNPLLNIKWDLPGLAYTDRSLYFKQNANLSNADSPWQTVITPALTPQSVTIPAFGGANTTQQTRLTMFALRGNVTFDNSALSSGNVRVSTFIRSNMNADNFCNIVLGPNIVTGVGTGSSNIMSNIWTIPVQLYTRLFNDPANVAVTYSLFCTNPATPNPITGITPKLSTEAGNNYISFQLNSLYEYGLLNAVKASRILDAANIADMFTQTLGIFGTTDVRFDLVGTGYSSSNSL